MEAALMIDPAQPKLDLDLYIQNYTGMPPEAYGIMSEIHD
jgi:hypothetical protein